jgi:hypothetical protein
MIPVRLVTWTSPCLLGSGKSGLTVDRVHDSKLLRWPTLVVEEADGPVCIVSHVVWKVKWAPGLISESLALPPSRRRAAPLARLSL